MNRPTRRMIGAAGMAVAGFAAALALAGPAHATVVEPNPGMQGHSLGGGLASGPVVVPNPGANQGH